jgi:hypothetical protein
MSTRMEQKVMANVGAIYTGRVLTGMTALKVYALILSVWGVGRLVWVSKVFQNFLIVEKNGAGSIFNYAVSSLTHTHVAVLAVLFVGTVAFVSLVVDAVRSIVTPRQFLSM